MQNPMMGGLMGLELFMNKLRTHEQFKRYFCNVFPIGNVRYSLWNGALTYCDYKYIVE